MRSHLEVLEITVQHAPRQDQLSFILAMSTGGRIHARAGGLKTSQIKSENGWLNRIARIFGRTGRSAAVPGARWTTRRHGGPFGLAALVNGADRGQGRCLEGRR